MPEFVKSYFCTSLDWLVFILVRHAPTDVRVVIIMATRQTFPFAFVENEYTRQESYPCRWSFEVSKWAGSTVFMERTMSTNSNWLVDRGKPSLLFNFDAKMAFRCGSANEFGLCRRTIFVRVSRTFTRHHRRSLEHSTN